MIIKRGDIVLTNLEPVMGSEQGRIRTCLVVQNDLINQCSPNTIIAPLTSKIRDKEYPTTVVVAPAESGLDKVSTILCNQVRTISIDNRVLKRLGSLKPGTMRKIDEALKTSLGLD
ncbi:MAG: type II toxin-antitoxin system PemK/MazF family toxin [Candidatus Diapherotrites archaeon]